jgi:hypothetical protein
MRTTLDIDDDVLEAAKELAVKEKTTAGKILSRFFRQALHGRGSREGEPLAARLEPPATLKNGVPILRSRGEIVTTEAVRRIMEEEGV